MALATGGGISDDASARGAVCRRLYIYGRRDKGRHDKNATDHSTG
jgi:hypothetical protein